MRPRRPQLIRPASVLWNCPWWESNPHGPHGPADFKSIPVLSKSAGVSPFLTGVGREVGRGALITLKRRQEIAILPSYFKRMEKLINKMLRTASLTQAATTTTTHESPEPEAKVTQSPDLPQHRSSGEERPEDHQVAEARLNRVRQQAPRNWREAAMADLPVVIMSHTIRIRTKG